MSTASTTCGQQQRRRHRRRCGRRPRRPARSPRRRPTPRPSRRGGGRRSLGIDDDAGVLQLLDRAASRGASANDATRTPSRMSRSTRASTSSAVGAQVHAERPVGALLDLADRGARARRSVIVADARMPSAARVARSRRRAGRRRPSPCPSARSGPRRRTASHERACAERRVHATRDLLPRRGRSGSMTSRMRRSSSSVGSAGLGHVVRDRRARSRSRRRPRRRSRRGAPTAAACGGRASRSRARARLVTTRRISWKRAASPELGGAVVADAATRRRPAATNTAGRVVRAPSTTSCR